MKGILIASLLLAAPFAAAEDAKLLAPKSENGVPVNYRMIYLDVPPDTAARVEVELADEGECFDTSIITWSKSMAGERRVHSLHFDAGLSSTAGGKRPAGCERRKVNHGRLHTVDLPAEKGGILAAITYREGEQVRATLGKSLPPLEVSPGRPGVKPTRKPKPS